jgi:hypothetical protein
MAWSDAARLPYYIDANRRESMWARPGGKPVAGPRRDPAQIFSRKYRPPMALAAGFHVMHIERQIFSVGSFSKPPLLRPISATSTLLWGNGPEVLDKKAAFSAFDNFLSMF